MQEYTKISTNTIIICTYLSLCFSRLTQLLGIVPWWKQETKPFLVGSGKQYILWTMILATFYNWIFYFLRATICLRWWEKDILWTYRLQPFCSLFLDEIWQIDWLCFVRLQNILQSSYIPISTILPPLFCQVLQGLMSFNYDLINNLLTSKKKADFELFIFIYAKLKHIICQVIGNM